MMMQQQKAAAAASSARAPAAVPRSRAVSVVARATKTKTTKAAEVAESPKKKGPGFLSQTISALDFSETRSKRDADLLYEAKYGKLEGGKMSREQYAALRRKVGGTAQDYFKEWVEEDVTPAYMKQNSGTQVPLLPVLIGVVFALVGVTIVVVEKTA